MKCFFSTLLGLLILISSTGNALNILNRGNGSEPDSLNIHLAEGLNSHNVLRDLYEGLMTVDVLGKPIFGAAQSFTSSNNVYIFKLRPQARWSDGSLVVAGDFVRAWQLAVNPKTAAPYAFLFNNIKNAKKIVQGLLSPKSLAIKALDDLTLEIQLNQPDSAFIEKLSLPAFFPLCKKQNSNHKIISNGAYVLDSWSIQEKISLKKNPYYYDKKAVSFDVVNYWVTDNQSSELKRFRAGELDITESIPDNQIDWIRQNLAQQLHIAPYLGSFFLGINTKDKYLQNHHLRQALSLAINREILTEKVLKTGQQPAYHVIPRSLLGRSTNSQVNNVERAIQAKKHFQQSGISPHQFKLEILYNNSDNQRKTALAIAAMWRQTLGIRAKLVNQEWKVFVQSRKSLKRQTFRSGWIADYADPLSFLELFISNSRFNFYHYKNIEFDRLIENIKATQDFQEKKQLTEQAENMILHDIPVIPLYYYVSRHLVNEKLLGFEDNVADRHLSKFLYFNGEKK